MTYHVLVSDSVDPAAVDLLRQSPALRVTAPGSMKRAEVLAAIGDADALIIRSATQADAELIEAGARLKVIARAGVGVDNVDLDAATRRGIVVMNTPGGNTISTAEYTIGLMLALARYIPQGDASLRGGAWDRKSFMGVELKGKTLGIIGLGRIGREVAKRAAAFEMTILGYDPYVDAAAVAPLGITLVSLDELYARSDFITLHSLITDETRGMINAASIARMKKGVRIVNAARGALINDHDLAEALKSGQVAGAALDVYESEPPPPDHPLIGLKNVIDTPHLAASTTDAQINVGIEAAQLVIDALTSGVYQNVCNPAVLSSVQKSVE
jgi:D-3-phosphoglycerate dehydrogenase